MCFLQYSYLPFHQEGSKLALKFSPPNLISATSNKIVALTCHKGCNTKCNLISLTSSLENQSSMCTNGFQQFGEKVSSAELWESFAPLSTLLEERERERYSFKLMLQRSNFPSDWETLDAKWVFAVLQYKQLLTTLEHNGSWMHHLSPLAAFSNC
jgi:hypothetical protein